jgi:hypothetical protein
MMGRNWLHSYLLLRPLLLLLCLLQARRVYQAVLLLLLLLLGRQCLLPPAAPPVLPLLLSQAAGLDHRGRNTGGVLTGVRKHAGPLRLLRGQLLSLMPLLHAEAAAAAAAVASIGCC